jgi:hypothetical protein
MSVRVEGGKSSELSNKLCDTVILPGKSARLRDARRVRIINHALQKKKNP